VKETGIPLEIVRKVCRSQFIKGVSDTMKDGNFDEIRLQYFGVFYPLENRINKHKVRKKDEHCNKLC
jgi:hypothetical protein